MSNHPVLSWIKQNLSPIIRDSIAAAKVKNPDLLYTEDLLAAITCRETGGLISNHLPSMGDIPSGRQVGVLAPLMIGDRTQRKGDPGVVPHGFGFTQIDIGSFPDFIRSGDWKDPAKCYRMSIAILEDDRAYLQKHYPQLAGDDLLRAIVAAYNCGAGNVAHVLDAGEDIDSRTTDKNYSANIWQYREWYMSL